MRMPSAIPTQTSQGSSCDCVVGLAAAEPGDEPDRLELRCSPRGFSAPPGYRMAFGIPRVTHAGRTNNPEHTTRTCSVPIVMGRWYRKPYLLVGHTLALGSSMVFP